MDKPSDAQAALRRRLDRNRFRSRTSTAQNTCPPLHPTPGRKYHGRSLGAGAFMKDETLRGMNGRVLRHGKFDCRARNGMLEEAFTSRIITAPSTPERRWGMQDEGPRTSSQAPPRAAIEWPDSPCTSEIEPDGEIHTWTEQRWEVYRSYLRRIRLDMRKADELFQMFIDGEQCEDMTGDSVLVLA